MSNKEIANHFDLLSKLLDIHGDASFRSKTYSIAAFRINQLEEDLASLSFREMISIEGIGEILGKKIQELITTGQLSALNKILEITPPGILEMTRIKGIGPKKIHLIWKKMGIITIADLLQACEENRLLNFNGFGQKTQQNIKDAIEFHLSQQGSILYSRAEELVTELKAMLETILGTSEIYISGEYARQMETIKQLDIVIPLQVQQIADQLQKHPQFVVTEQHENHIICSWANGIPVYIYSGFKDMASVIFTTTGSANFVDAFMREYPTISLIDLTTEAEIFSRAKLQFIPACLRETPQILNIAKRNKIPQLIQPGDIKGIIHCHSNWSDGIHSVEQMAKACIKNRFEYMVISDHSKAASYANGLTEDRIMEQHFLIDELNEKLEPFKIFKSIECDILGNGDLDYDSKLLSSMDLVITSIHSNLQMSEEKAMTRLLKAIENPHTTILGHLTGRLLLLRRGYSVNYEQIIDACAKHDVVIEINANPRRLDMTWEWIPYALEKGVLLSINPDAHSIEEFQKTKYGVLSAQKGMLTAASNLSSFGLKEFEGFLKMRRKHSF